MSVGYTKVSSFSRVQSLPSSGAPRRSNRREPGSGIGTLNEISSSGSVSASAKVYSIDVRRLARVADDEEGGDLDAGRPVDLGGADALLDGQLLVHEVERLAGCRTRARGRPSGSRPPSSAAPSPASMPLARERQLQLRPSGAMRRQNSSRYAAARA